jgi:hypothetical protein
MTKTIGFFGDSFCAERTNHHRLYYKYNTYMDLLAKHYDAKVVNVGKGGSSVYDTILIQLKPFLDSNTVPDICVFVWTNSGRLFNRQVRRINHKSALTFKPSLFNIFEQGVWKAAKQYYEQLYDQEKEDLEYVALLNYVDNILLKQLPPTTKIVHLWSFGDPEWHNKNFRPSATKYPYAFRTGAEIRPALSCVSLYDNDVTVLHVDHRCNHLDGQYKNNLVFRWIKEAIEGENTGLDRSDQVEKLFDKSPATDRPAT